MKNRVFVVPSMAVSMLVIVIAFLFIFRGEQESKIYTVQLALPFLLGVALFYFLALSALGSAQTKLASPSVVKMLYLATLVVGVFTLVLFLLFLLFPNPPEGAVGSKPAALEVLRGLFVTVFLPLWVAYVSGGLVQYLFMKGVTQR